MVFVSLQDGHHSYLLVSHSCVVPSHTGSNLACMISDMMVVIGDFGYKVLNGVATWVLHCKKHCSFHLGLLDHPDKGETGHCVMRTLEQSVTQIFMERTLPPKASTNLSAM